MEGKGEGLGGEGEEDVRRRVVRVVRAVEEGRARLTAERRGPNDGWEVCRRGCALKGEWNSRDKWSYEDELKIFNSRKDK